MNTKRPWKRFRVEQTETDIGTRYYLYAQKKGFLRPWDFIADFGNMAQAELEIKNMAGKPRVSNTRYFDADGDEEYEW